MQRLVAGRALKQADDVRWTFEAQLSGKGGGGEKKKNRTLQNNSQATILEHHTPPWWKLVHILASMLASEWT